MPTLDHLVWGAPNLEAGIEEFERLTGVRAAKGGRHPDHGTCNALATLENNTYFEILSPDPTLEPSERSELIAQIANPALIAWAARTADAEETAALAEAAGYSVTLFPMSRTTPDGRTLRWKIVRLADHGGGTYVPFFIDWLDTPHPSLETPTGLRLISFTIESADPMALTEIFNTLNVEVDVVLGSSDQLIARLETPKGEVTLTGQNPGFTF